MKFLFKKDFWLGLIQPFLISVLPIFYLYSLNFGEVCVIEPLFLLLMFLFLTLTLFFIIYIFVKDYFKCSLLLSLLYLFLIIASYLYYFIYILPIGVSFKIIRARYFLGFLLLVSLLLALYILSIKKSKKFFSSFLIIPFSVILLFYFGVILKKFISTRALHRSYSIDNKKFRKTNLKRFKHINDIKHKPDIYYLILDAHTSFAVLNRYYNYNNNKFLKSLEQKGFFIAKESLSNYPRTEFSIPSSLNMRYFKLSFCEEPDIFYTLSKKIVVDSNVKFFLSKFGYEFVNIPAYGDLFSFKEKSLHKFDYNIGNNIIGSFSQNLFRIFFMGKYYLGYLLNVFASSNKEDKYSSRDSVLAQLPAIKNVVSWKSPKFVFAHIFCPHVPFVFDENGNWPHITDCTSAYLNQLTFIDKQIIKVVDEILKKSKHPPIIIIQGDHGCRESIDLNKKNFKEIREIKYGILNVFYFPKFPKEKLWNTISPVNSFRLIFNHYFGANFEILKDESVEVELVEGVSACDI